ncbi:uncharacterized protein LOC128553752, partial [Mercenaria mercenaria]|uniref:uncharacterized protein LOC128553752 n=1 Tax=Mercenaria mercenaria TaxID=6596 RepID=UPI00234F17DF
FPLSNTTESKTKGIWAWCRIHPKHDNHVLLLLDTEGLCDIAKGDADHDNKIFTIAALLCNVLVYNMMSAFNQDAVEKLTFISEMSKNISFARGENTDEKFDLILPTFVLCLRDFMLELEKDGEELTADEYLEDCLELKPVPPNGKKDAEKYNRPREYIRKYFPKRKCFTFDRPGDKKVMWRLETAKADELSEDFREETKQFLGYVYNCKAKVLLNSKSVRGKMFATLATSYIKAIRNGAIPDVDDAFQTVAKMENERMAIEAVKEFSARVYAIELPVLHIQEFDKIYGDIQNASLANFRSEALFESAKFEKGAIAEMENIWKLIKNQNCELVRYYCLTQLKEIFGDVVEQKKAKDIYLAAGGYEDYKCDIGKVKKAYKLKMQGIDEYETEMENIWKLIKNQNCELVRYYCLTQLKEIFGDVAEQKKAKDIYLVAGGYEDYKCDIGKVKKAYKLKMQGIDEYEVTHVLNEFFEGKADYEREVMRNDKKLTEEDRKREIVKMIQVSEEARKEQSRLFCEKYSEEKQRAEEHYKKLEAEREAYVQLEDEKMGLIMKTWVEQKELRELQMQMMKTENEKQRQELKEEIRQLNEANRIKEKENTKRFDTIIAQEKENNKLQIDKMNEGFSYMVAVEKEMAEAYKNDTKLFQNSLIELYKKHCEERKKAEREYAKKHVDDNTMREIYYQKMLDQDQIDSDQGRLNAENARDARERLDGEKRQNLRSHSRAPASNSRWQYHHLSASSVWSTCIKQKDEKMANELLKSKILPDMKSLNDLCQEDGFGRMSAVAIAASKEICHHIKNKSNKIRHVWAAREAVTLTQGGSHFDIKFVVITEELNEEGRKDLEEILKESDYETLPLRDLSSEETCLIMERGYKFTEEEQNRIKACIARNADKLLQKHTYLSIISGCPFKSSGYDKSNHKVTATPCIVLNVQYKGYIPIDEEPFELQYDGVQVDVREDIFVPYNYMANERHDYLKVGCLISGEKNQKGTLGGFVYHPDYGLCGMSCSHTLLSPSELVQLAGESQEINWSRSTLSAGRNVDTWQGNVYQPFKEGASNDNAADDNKIGRLVRVIHRHGDPTSKTNDAYGIDIALFQLSRRLPNSSDFPVVKVSGGEISSTGNDEDSPVHRKIPVQFGTGTVAGFAWHEEKAFSKYGAITGYTVGEPFDYGITVKGPFEWTYKTPNEQVQFEFILHNQLSFRLASMGEQNISPFDRPEESLDLFAYKGDSGSLVYRETMDGNLVCVGIVVGGRKSQKTCIITPILPILKEMGISNFKNFDSERMERNVKTMMVDVNTIKEKIEKIDKNMADGFANILAQLNKI